MFLDINYCCSWNTAYNNTIVYGDSDGYRCANKYVNTYTDTSSSNSDAYASADNADSGSVANADRTGNLNTNADCNRNPVSYGTADLYTSTN